MSARDAGGRVKKLLVVSIACALVATCGSPPPKSGRVVDKRYDPAHWESGYRTEYRMNYKCETKSEYNFSTKQYEPKQSCGMVSEPVQVYESHHHWVEDEWSLKLQACKTKDDERKCKSGWRSITRHTYHRYDIGDFYSSEGE